MANTQPIMVLYTHSALYNTYVQSNTVLLPTMSVFAADGMVCSTRTQHTRTHTHTSQHDAYVGMYRH